MNILIVSNRANTKTTDTFYQIAAYFDSQGIAHTDLDVSDLPTSAFVYNSTPDEVRRLYGGPYDLIITLGGDGTILHTSRLAYLLDAPILGINLGHLGFLANTVESSAIALIADALAGEILSEPRMNLKIQVVCEGDDLGDFGGELDDKMDGPGFLDETEADGSASPRVFYAMNEITIARGAAGHIVDFEFSIAGDKIAKMRGDGLIVATATGSTAYSLSAGGPLVGPNQRGMIVVPLAPHTLNSRAIVTEHHDVVEVTFEEGSASAREVALFVDGDAVELERPVSSVIVSVGENPTTLLTCRRESFYKQISRTFFSNE